MRVVRDARPDDAMAVAEVHVRTWRAAYRGLLPDSFLASLRPADRASRYTFAETGANRRETILVLVDDVICGFATVGAARDADGAGLGELYAIYVAPEAWGSGLGRALMAEAKARLLRRGFIHAQLWVFAANHAARRFYEFDGWGTDGRQQTVEIGGVAPIQVGYLRPIP